LFESLQPDGRREELTLELKLSYFKEDEIIRMQTQRHAFGIEETTEKIGKDRTIEKEKHK